MNTINLLSETHSEQENVFTRRPATKDAFTTMVVADKQVFELAQEVESMRKAHAQALKAGYVSLNN